MATSVKTWQKRSLCVFRKISEEQVQANLTRYGLPDNVTAEVKEVAAKMPEFQEKEQEEQQSYGFRR